MSNRVIDKSPVYLLFGTHINGHTDLLSVDTELWISRRHRAVMENADEQYIRIWVEGRERNHLYGASMDARLRDAAEAADAELAENAAKGLVGDDSLTEREAQQLLNARREINRLRDALEVATLRAKPQDMTVVLSKDHAHILASVARAWLERKPRDYDGAPVLEAINSAAIQVSASTESWPKEGTADAD